MCRFFRLVSSVNDTMQHVMSVSSLRIANMHVLEKLWAVSRVLLFASRTPKHVFTFTLVNRAFRECIIEYELGASIFNRIFDARNEWQSEQDVKQVWTQAAAIILKQETAQHEQLPPFKPELFGEMVAALRNENARAAVEYARIPHEEREERETVWQASPHYVEDDRSDYSQMYALFTAKNPLPASVFARNRLAQTRGTLFVAFRGCETSIDWTRYVAVAERVVLNLGNSQLSGPVDLTQLPQSLQQLDLCNNKLCGSVDLTQLPQSLQWLDLYGNQLSGTVDLTHLPQSLRLLYLGDNQLSGSVDLTQLPQSLRWLNLDNNKFRGTVRRSMLPTSLKLSADNSGLTVIP
jgi:hypothetical protein